MLVIVLGVARADLVMLDVLSAPPRSPGLTGGTRLALAYCGKGACSQCLSFGVTEMKITTGSLRCRHDEMAMVCARPKGRTVVPLGQFPQCVHVNGGRTWCTVGTSLFDWLDRGHSAGSPRSPSVARELVVNVLRFPLRRRIS